jgi:tripartite-type tricarboxylate transporter receptor subunit TctC
MRHLPTNGGGPALTALLGNNAQVLVSSVAAARSHIASGKARALGAFTDKRIGSLPDVPTLKEQGLDVEFYLWVGMFAPKGTPEAIVQKLRTVAGQAIASPQFKTAVTNLGDEIHYLDGPDFQKFWDTDAKRVEDAVAAIGKL